MRGVSWKNHISFSHIFQKFTEFHRYLEVFVTSSHEVRSPRSSPSLCDWTTLYSAYCDPTQTVRTPVMMVYLLVMGQDLLCLHIWGNNHSLPIYNHLFFCTQTVFSNGLGTRFPNSWLIFMDVHPPKNAIPNLKKSSLLMAQLFKFVAPKRRSIILMARW